MYVGMDELLMMMDAQHLLGTISYYMNFILYLSTWIPIYNEKTDVSDKIYYVETGKIGNETYDENEAIFIFIFIFHSNLQKYSCI